ncbi:DUF4430 domain-containing protein [Collinsella aerofaciens]|uniref:DUF4430 domain-containing protein n=1 Tax=Collinsella aerofaciens TaxID=74426 RepID=UPI00232DB800|nr:DUF4430 domain-containing protein [Collinsella aerofaciens]MDB1820727.1 DUF4430 domain-containing protein [Collinsella aerofaciens]
MSNKPQDAESKQPDSSFIQLDDAKKKDAASAASAPRRKALFGALTAVCIVLIVVSLGFVQPSSSGAWSIDWIARAVAGKSVAGSGSTASRKTEAAGSSSSDAVDSESKDSDESDSKDKSESSDKKSDKDSKEKKSEGKGGKKSSNTSAGQGSEFAGGSSSSSGSDSASGGGSASNSGGASAGNQDGSQQPGYVTVTVSVTSSAVGNPVSSSGTFTFNKGATVYDALCALGLSVNARGTSYGTYVAAIGGLAEKEHGGTSGWMYSVNGATPNTACSNYVLSNGDTVVWYYVTG